MRRKLHSHPCAKEGCSEAVPCDGLLERNVDGFPEVTCDQYHQDSGEVAEVFCWKHDEREAEDCDMDAWQPPFARNH